MTFPVPSLLLLGPTGSGKSPLGGLIARFGLLGTRCHHLDFGSELRSIASAGNSDGSFTHDERVFIRGVLADGLLLENDHFVLVAKIIRMFLFRVSFLHDHILVLNGIPRHVGQARDLSEIAVVRAVIELSCSSHDVFCRLGTDIGGDRAGRTDDNRDLVEKKLAIYSDRTKPLITYYRDIGAKIYSLAVSSKTTTEEKYQALLSLAAADPPVSLVAEPPQG